MYTGISVLFVLCLFSQFCLVVLYLVSLWSEGLLVRHRSMMYPVPGGKGWVVASLWGMRCVDDLDFSP